MVWMASRLAGLAAAHLLVSKRESVWFIINPRRACAARVTVVVLCVCQCVSVSAALICN